MVMHIIEAQQLSRGILLKLFKRADQLRENPSNFLKGKILTSLFYEPSTRTRLSFEAAMLKLGGSVMGTENAREFSSVSKGESLEDSIRVIAGYSDVIILRNSIEGSSKLAACISSVPVINAGEGSGQHPTQAILDSYTLYREFGSLENLKIAAVGDLKYGRTIRSLCYLLGKFTGIELIFVSPENLKMKDDIKEYLLKHNTKFIEVDNLEEVLPMVDVIYMTRIQKERINKEEYELAKGKFVLNESNLNLIKEGAIIMHPLPHVEEINLSIKTEQNDSRIAYFRQAENGLYIRMAILEEVMKEKEK
ncbi:MAG: aspartate carbamoyltransferase [Nanoarchaeota archaeon]|nr:aspartate carbamoyltransferase [Nanoarchaeota archaeon]